MGGFFCSFICPFMSIVLPYVFWLGCLALSWVAMWLAS